jgi:hypothetical protein
MPSFLFDLGNSHDGPMGLVVRVRAAEKTEALDHLRGFLARSLDDAGGIDLPAVDEDEGVIEYGRIYIAPQNITVADICDGETEEDDEEGEAT